MKVTNTDSQKNIAYWHGWFTKCEYLLGNTRDEQRGYLLGYTVAVSRDVDNSFWRTH
jgi:hypothetical protein